MTIAQHARPTSPTPERAAATQLRWLDQTQIADFGVAVHDAGLGAYPQLVRELARAGSRVSPAAAAVLASESEPIVARERALAVVSAALVRTHSPSRSDVPTSRGPEGVQKLLPSGEVA